MSCEETTTTSGLWKDVKLYQSYELGNYSEDKYNDRFRALKNAKTYIEGAFDYTDHYVSVDYETDEPSIREQCWDSFDQAHPCQWQFTVTWDNPKEYFKEWVTCKDKPTGGDQTIFLTNCGAVHGGIGGEFAWTQSGQNVANLPTDFYGFGTGSDFGGMSTVLHEMGHRFMKNDPCGNTDYSEHHFGRLGEYGWSDHYQTPMGKWDRINPSENACCQDHITDGTTYWKQSWSDCCLNTWEC